MLVSPSLQKWESFELIVVHTKDFLDDDAPLQLQGSQLLFDLALVFPTLPVSSKS
jgi:hypothetical protein